MLAFPGGAEWLLLFFVLGILVAYFALILQLWRRPDVPTNEKLLWTILILMAPLLGVIIYALFGRRPSAINRSVRQ